MPLTLRWEKQIGGTAGSNPPSGSSTQCSCGLLRIRNSYATKYDAPARLESLAFAEETCWELAWCDTESNASFLLGDYTAYTYIVAGFRRFHFTTSQDCSTHVTVLYIYRQREREFISFTIYWKLRPCRPDGSLWQHLWHYGAPFVSTTFALLPRGISNGRSAVRCAFLI